ncbi:unnamed protein product [Acanthosepion pharaonis]|uniref:Uncharacterized protein n=1 Tax=Acanthosepion pharaonis TaxID=158019 RepID=A0A812CV41_ACAPH|nr:unnamed protein product [Sepia pharaonis]
MKISGISLSLIVSLTLSLSLILILSLSLTLSLSYSDNDSLTYPQDLSYFPIILIFPLTLSHYLRHVDKYLLHFPSFSLSLYLSLSSPVLIFSDSLFLFHYLTHTHSLLNPQSYLFLSPSLSPSDTHSLSLSHPLLFSLSFIILLKHSFSLTSSRSFFLFHLSHSLCLSH